MHYKIVQRANTQFTIQLDQPNRLLMESLAIPGATTTPAADEIRFQAINIDRNHPTSPHALVQSLTIQLQRLLRAGYCILNYSAENLVTINHSNPIYIFDIDDIYPLHSNNTLVITRPFDKHALCAPEVLQITTLPAKVHYKAAYYSLARLVQHVTTVKIPYKIHHLLKRALQETPDKRSILFI